MDFKVVETPWRFKYVQTIGTGGCFLCKAAAEVNNDDENLVPARGRHVFVILNKYPYTWGHLMVVPYRHIANFEELTVEEWAEMVEMAKKAIKALKKAVGARDFIVGINVGRAAGAGLESHIHLHVIPKDRAVEEIDLENALVKLTRVLRSLI